MTSYNYKQAINAAQGIQRITLGLTFFFTYKHLTFPIQLAFLMELPGVAALKHHLISC